MKETAGLLGGVRLNASLPALPRIHQRSHQQPFDPHVKLENAKWNYCTLIGSL